MLPPGGGGVLPLHVAQASSLHCPSPVLAASPLLSVILAVHLPPCAESSVLCHPASLPTAVLDLFVLACFVVLRTAAPFFVYA